jgi:purine nucleosidase
LGPPRAAVSGRYGPTVIVERARQHAGELVLVATGPLTNVALALRQEPELPRLLRRLALMGGSFDHTGNTTPVAEFNVWVDPEAAAAVFLAFSSAADRPLIAGLNVTDHAQLMPAHIARLGGGEIAEFLAAALRVKFDDKGFARMHDPLALALALDPTLCTTRAGTVDVELAGTLTRAMTVVDWHGLWERPANADVAVSVDYDRFLDRLVERLAALQG